jgi:CCR4-NOT transcription complex subunit 3
MAAEQRHQRQVCAHGKSKANRSGELSKVVDQSRQYLTHSTSMQQMERFKASEKELKTKAFSKEGLIAASRLDPAEKAKLELSQWLSGMVDELARQVETTEAEIEQLAGGTKKKKGGTSNERAAQLDNLNERRKWHSSRLEILLRMLENGTLETERVSDIKEDISYFVESNADEDFEEDEGIYDEYNLDEEEEAFGLRENEDISNQDTVSIPDGEIKEHGRVKHKLTTYFTEPPTPSKVLAKESAKGRRESEEPKVEEKTPKKGALASGLATTTPRKVSGSEPSAKDVKAIPPVNFAQAKAAPATSPSSTVHAPLPAKVATTSSLPPIRYAAAAAAAVSPSQPIPSTNASAPSPIATTEALPSDNAAASPPPPTSSSRGETNGTSSFSPALSHAQSTSMQSNSVTSTPAIEHAKPVEQQQQQQSEEATPAGPTNGATSSPNRSHEASSLRQGSVNVSRNSPSVSSAIAAPGSSMTDGAGTTGQSSSNVDGTAGFQPAQLAASSAAAGVVQPAGGGAGTSSQQAAAQKQHGTEARLPSSLADLVSSFESAKQNSMRRDNDLGQVHASLESSFMNVPEPQDSDRPKYYVPQNPYPTPHWYPQTPASIFDNPAIYTKLDDDTLFYIFYYSQRDYHRYLAARELKRQSWRFSIRYGTWFRRHSEPIVINEEYEEGS